MPGRTRRYIRLPFAILTVALTLIALQSTLATAHTSVVNQGDDQVVTDPDHMSGSVCDLEKDGNRVIARWYTDEGGEIASADIGGQYSCEEESWGVEADYVTLCEYGAGEFKCTGRHRV